MRIEGFRDKLEESRRLVQETFPGFNLTGPEATAYAVKFAVQGMWGLLSGGRIGESKSTEEVFGISYKEFLAECNRRQKLAGTSKAMESARKKMLG